VLEHQFVLLSLDLSLVFSRSVPALIQGCLLWLAPSCIRAAAAKDMDKILSATLKIAIIATMPICRELEIFCGPDPPKRLMAEFDGRAKRRRKFKFLSRAFNKSELNANLFLHVI